MDEGTENLPITIECPLCDGQGCDKCDDGEFNLVGCPNRYCEEIASAIELIDLFGEGIPPISGGALDQAVWFIEASRVLKQEEMLAKAEANVGIS